MNQVLDIIKNTSLTYHQQLKELAVYGENTLDVLQIDQETKKLIEDGIICSLFEGNAPYRPRYILPDYEKLMKEGCQFLELDPPTDIWEAINNLLIFYKHVPSITTYPVYLGNMDTLLEPFVEDEVVARKAIKLFLQHIDKTLTDSFVHGNIGPRDTKAGRIILDVMKELNYAMPNLTVKVDKELTSKEFMTLCAETALVTAKPSFANHAMYVKDFGSENYAIASCYNGFHIGGGGYTLVRLILSKLTKQAQSIDEFLEEILPFAAGKMLEYIDERIRFLVEEAAFFKSNFLVKEGFIKPDLFVGMFGVVGLAETVNDLLQAKEKSQRFGYAKKANDLGLTIIKKLDAIVSAYVSKYVECFQGHHVLHAQVGIDTDINASPGCRIPIGEEPDTYDHILQSAPFHQYFFNGIGDIFVFEDTYQEHPEALVNIVHGAIESGVRYFSAYGSGSDVVRVTGYLAKRSEIEKLEKGEAVVNNATVFAMGQKNNSHSLVRKIRS